MLPNAEPQVSWPDRIPFFAIVGSLSFALHCDGTRPTPVGTTLVDIASVDPAGLGARTGPAAAFERKYAFRDHGAAIDAVGAPAFRVTFEYGPAALSGDTPGRGRNALALQNVRIIVTRNERWAISARCDPPTLLDDVSSAGTRTSWMQCAVAISRQNGRVTFTSYVQITASPSVSASRGLEWSVEEE